MPHNVLRLGLVPVVRNVKCTNVQRDIKMQNEQALAQGAVTGCALLPQIVRNFNY